MTAPNRKPAPTMTTEIEAAYQHGRDDKAAEVREFCHALATADARDYWPKPGGVPHAVASFIARSPGLSTADVIDGVLKECSRANV